MWLQRLTVDGIRNLKGVDVTLDPGIQFFRGENGAGKTSILEAVYCLSSGRSFRGGHRAEYIDREAREATIFAEIHREDRHHRLGLTRSASEWRARLDGEELTSLGDLARCLAVLCFHPQLHQLIEGAPEDRRRFLDFGVFHVEHQFLGAWRQYRRALKQRNAALRAGADHSVWDPVLVSSGVELTGARAAVAAQLAEEFRRMLAYLGPELAGIELSFRSGWRDGESLADCLAAQAERDRSQGHTSMGPHRADLRLADETGRVAGRLSRGQQKIVVLALTLAMRHLMKQAAGTIPVLCVDDFASELDEQHQLLVLDHLAESPGQVLLTGTDVPAFVSQKQPDAPVFHVEHGRVRGVA